MQPEHELYIFRRHLETCEYFGPGGREIRADQCNCPFHVDGLHHGQRVRESLRTASRQLAERRLAERMRSLDSTIAAPHGIGNSTESEPIAMRLTVSDAADRFLKGHGEIGQDGKYRGDSERGTRKKYRCGLRLLVSFCESTGIAALAELTPDALEDFRGTRNIGRVTWKVERQKRNNTCH